MFRKFVVALLFSVALVSCSNGTPTSPSSTASATPPVSAQNPPATSVVVGTIKIQDPAVPSVGSTMDRVGLDNHAVTEITLAYTYPQNDGVYFAWACLTDRDGFFITDSCNSIQVSPRGFNSVRPAIRASYVDRNIEVTTKVVAYLVKGNEVLWFSDYGDTNPYRSEASVSGIVARDEKAWVYKWNSMVP